MFPLGSRGRDPPERDRSPGGLTPLECGIVCFPLFSMMLVNHCLRRSAVSGREREKCWLVFHACCGKNHPDHLTEGEFSHAMAILAPHLDAFHVRNLFHEIDENGNGIIDVDEFLLGIDIDALNAEE